MPNERPTDEDKADAVMRFMDEVDKAHIALSAARAVVRERREQGSSSPHGPLFPFTGDSINFKIDAARQALWDAAKIVAPQFLEARRAIERDVAATISTSRKCVIAHPDQRIDPLWLGDREIRRSRHVPLGVAYEFDPAILDFKGGLGA